MSTNNDLVLLLPSIATQDEKPAPSFLPSSGAVQQLDHIPVTMEQINGIASHFSGLEIDSLEIHITGAAKSGQLTQLVVGLSGEAGVKITLKKKVNE